MAVRNFYIEADIDGRQTTLGGGPRTEDGEMTVHIHQREDGGINSDVVKICCRERKGELTTEVYDNKGELLFTYNSKR